MNHTQLITHHYFTFIKCVVSSVHLQNRRLKIFPPSPIFLVTLLNMVRPQTSSRNASLWVRLTENQCMSEGTMMARSVCTQFDLAHKLEQVQTTTPHLLPFVLVNNMATQLRVLDSAQKNQTVFLKHFCSQKLEP